MTKSKMPTEERILSAAAGLFALKGYEGTTTREIVKEANASLSSMQLYFGSKEGEYKAVLDKTMAAFAKKTETMIGEIDKVEKLGLLNKGSSWDMIVSLTDAVIEWAFNKDYAVEIMLIQKELMQPSPFFKPMPESVKALYQYYEKLFRVYASADDSEDWVKGLSFTIVTTIFAFANMPQAMEEVIGKPLSDPDTIISAKVRLKRYLLTGLRPYLNFHREEKEEE